MFETEQIKIAIAVVAISGLITAGVLVEHWRNSGKITKLEASLSAATDSNKDLQRLLREQEQSQKTASRIGEQYEAQIATLRHQLSVVPVRVRSNCPVQISAGNSSAPSTAVAGPDAATPDSGTVSTDEAAELIGAGIEAGVQVTALQDYISKVCLAP